MSNELNIKYPKSPGLTLEQAKELSEKLNKFKADLDVDNIAVYLNWPDKTKSHL